MASTLGASASSPAGSISLTKNLSDADASRVLAFAVALYGGTNAQAFQSMMSAAYQDLMRKVGNYERELARSAADTAHLDPALS